MKFFKFLAFIFIITTVNKAQSDDSFKLYDETEVDTIEISIDQAALDWIYNNVQSDSMHYSTIRYKNKWFDEFVDSVGFRLRGNTSRDALKKSFKLSFNTFIHGRKFHGVEKLNLNGEHNDPSIIRSKLCWDLFSDIGETASRASHVAVFINGTFYGLYISVEHIDEEFLSKNYPDDSGNLWKCRYPADLSYRGANPENYYPYYGDDRPYELKTNKNEYDFTQLARLISILHLTPDNLLADSLESVLDLPSVLKYFAMDVLVGSWDDYRSLMNNYYLYYEPSSGKFHLIPYDYDNTFGVDWFDLDWANVSPYDFPQVAAGERPLLDRILANNQYRNLFTHFLDFYSNNVFLYGQLTQHINSIKDLITPFVRADSFRTLDYGFTMSDFYSSYSAQHYSNQHVKYGLQEFIIKRDQSLQGMLNYEEAEPIVYDINYFPKNPTAADSIKITASVFNNDGFSSVGVMWEVAGLPAVIDYPMEYTPAANSKKVEENDLWSVTLPPMEAGSSAEFKVYVTDNNATVFTYPRTKYLKITIPSSDAENILINEFMASNDTTIADQNGEYDDWVELFNPSNSIVDLSGKKLTDNPDALAKWSFPSGTTIAPGGHLLIWCDKDEEQSGLHTNFKLSAGGEFLALVASDGVTVIDSMSFGEQTTDISFGRYPDGSSDMMFMQPTPGESNTNVLDVENETGNSLSQFRLFQNYPNPFSCKAGSGGNSITTIKYSIPAVKAKFARPTNVKLIVYDILGRKIATLVNERQEPGNYFVNFDASSITGGLPSGIYFYRLQSGRFTRTRKMILMK